MANALRKQRLLPRKDDGLMEKEWDFLEATQRLDIEGMRNCLANRPESIRDVDESNNNAMHLCVTGYVSLRAPHVVDFLLEETEIDLLHVNDAGFNPLELAFAYSDHAGAEKLLAPTHRQLEAKDSGARPRHLRVVPPIGGGSDPESSPT